MARSKKQQLPIATLNVAPVMRRDIKPKTQNQMAVWEAYKDEQNIMLHGVAGTGKSFILLYLALREALNPRSEVSKVMIVRSIVPTRDVGFLPGDIDEKISVYAEPYRAIVSELFPDMENAFDMLQMQDKLEFVPTSYIRGLTVKDAIIIVDEMQNLTFHELDSIITRVGDNSRIMFAGDYKQSDLNRDSEKQGLKNFMKILDQMDCFDTIEMGVDDIVRSGLVREYLLVKNDIEYCELFDKQNEAIRRKNVNER
jgi:phosphate starvation-inducible PhoH-like protein